MSRQSSVDSRQVAVRVNGVGKVFKLPREKHTSLKSAFINIFTTGRRYSLQKALQDVSFEVKKGEFFGIVGRNGSGKSTLLKIIASIYQPTSGKLEVSGKLVPFIELGVGFNPELTGRENVYLNGALLGFSQKQIDAKYSDIVEFAELEKFMDQKLKNYSSGMQVRLAFSMAVRAEADILLIDEVLAVGDAAFQRKCFEYFKTLKKNNKTVIFVSHDMGAIREFCDRAMLIDNGEVKAIGKTSDIADKYGQLFIDEDPSKETEKEKEGKRWGNGDIKIQSTKVLLVEDEVIITAEALAHKPVNGVIYGLHIVAQDGVEVTAMNNRMLHQQDLAPLEAGSRVVFSWKMLDIFNDGKYFITLTLVNDAGIAFDWFTDAASFIVKKPTRSTTAVLPPVSVKYTIVN